MKTSHLLAAAALSLLAAAGAHAETYHGVAAPVSAMSRADIEAEAARTAAAPNQNVVRGSRVNSRVISTMPNRADTLQQAQKQGAPAAK